MDEQNPRLSAERISGRVDEQLGGYDAEARDSDTARVGTTAARRNSETASVAPAEPRTREIRAEIEQTREQMSETVEAIQERLRPSNMAANAADSVRHAARERVRDVAESESVQYVRANPFPTAMVGIGLAGLAWLAFGGNEPRLYAGSRSTRGGQDWRRRLSEDRQRSYYRETDTAYGTASGYTPGLAYAETDSYYRESSRPSGEYSSGAQGDFSASARDTAARARQTARRTWNDNPIFVGAASAVLGAVIGLSLPETERENELMGETRDSLLDTVQDTVREKVSEVKEAASSAMSTVQDAAANAAGLSSEQTSRNDTANTRERS